MDGALEFRPDDVVRGRLLVRAVEDENGCWIWLGCIRHGYGQIRFEGRQFSTHRLAFTAFKGAIPAGMTVDHICYQTACINPDHLRLLSRSENSARQRSRERAECPEGHPFTTENTLRHRRLGSEGQVYFTRTCRACRNAKSRQVWQANKPQGISPVRSYRRAARLSQQEVADRMTAAGFRWRQQLVNKVEFGNRHLRDAEAVVLAHILGAPVSALVSDTCDEQATA